MVEPQREIEGLRALFRSERDPEGRAFVPLADAYRRSRDLTRALQIVNEGLEQHPNLASAHVVAAWIHRDRGDRATARASWKRVLELDGENVEALRGLGTLLLEAGRSDEARPYLEKLRSLDPDDPDVHGQLSRLEPELAQAAAGSETAPTSAEATPPFPPAPADDWAAALGEPATRPTVEPALKAEPATPEVEALLQDWPAPPEEPASAAAAPPAEPLAEGRVDGAPTEGAPAEPVGAEPTLAAPAMRAEAAEVAPEAELRLQEIVPISEPAEHGEEPIVIAAGAAELLLGDGEITDVWGEGTLEEEDSEPAELPATRTLAELFARQGLHARAAEIYERLLEESPDDDRLRDRLAQLRGVSRPRGAPHPSVHAEDTEAIAAAMGWSATHAEPSASPFGWAPEEPAAEEVEDGAPISTYFRRLLEWRPGSGSAASPPSSIAPAEAPFAEAPEETTDLLEGEVERALTEPTDLLEGEVEGALTEPTDLLEGEVERALTEPEEPWRALAEIELAGAEPEAWTSDAEPDAAVMEPAPWAASVEPPDADPILPAGDFDTAVMEPEEVAQERFESISERAAVREVVPIHALAPDRIVAIEDLAPSPVVRVASLAPDTVPIESLAPDEEPSHDSSTIRF